MLEYKPELGHCCLDTPPGFTPTQEAEWRTALRRTARALAAVMTGAGYGEITIPVKAGTPGVPLKHTTERVDDVGEGL